MERILVSACLLGSKVRHDGSAKLEGHPILLRWQCEGRIVPICPELAAGFPAPRPAAEIVGAGGGEAVLAGHVRVLEETGSEVTGSFLEGAKLVLRLARQQGCRFAVLTDGSPSCGSTFIRDGSFARSRVAGMGVTAALLRRHGIAVFSEREIERLAALVEDRPASRAGSNPSRSPPE